MAHTVQSSVDFPTVMKTFEVIVYNLAKNPNSSRMNAELAEFKRANQSNLITIMRHIIEQSNQILSVAHALILLREETLSRWAEFSDEYTIKLRNFLLEFAGTQVALDNPTVRNQLFKTAAAFVKRSWLSIQNPDTQDQLAMRQILMQQIISMMQTDNIYAKEISVNFSIDLVQEFSVASGSTKLDLPWDFHKRAKDNFEQRYLPQLFVSCIQTVQPFLVSDSKRESSARLFQKCLELLERILTWPFNAQAIGATNILLSEITFEPGESWRDILVKNPALLDTYFKMYLVSRDNSDHLNLVTQGLIQLASLRGSVFEDKLQQQNYLQNYLHGVFSIMFIPNETLSGEEILNVALLMNRFATNFPLEMFQSISTSSPVFFGHLAIFTCSVLQLISTAKRDEDRDSLLSSFGELLEAWVLFVGELYPISPEKLSLFHEFCSEIFRSYVNMRIQIPSDDSAHRKAPNDDDDDDVTNDMTKDYISKADELESIAHLARVSTSNSAHFLQRMIAEKSQSVVQLIQSEQNSQNQIDLKKLFYELHWLILISGHVISDNPNEVESGVPPIINYFSQKISQNDPVVSLIEIIFKLAEFENYCLSHGKISSWSTTLAESLVWFFHRWSQAYLYLPSDDMSPTLVKAFGSVTEVGPIANTTQFLLRKILVNLQAWKDCKSIVEKSCELLQGIARRRLPVTVLSTIPVWGELFYNHVTSNLILLTLPSSVQKKLIGALVCMQCGADNREKISYFDQIVAPVKNRLAIITHREFPILAVKPDVLAIVVNELHRARGIIISCSPYTIPFAWNFCMELLPALISTFKIYSKNHIVVQLILGLWLDISKNLIDGLSLDQHTHFLEKTIELFEAYQLVFGQVPSPVVKPQTRNGINAKEQRTAEKVTRILKIVYEIASREHHKSSRTSYFGISVVSAPLSQNLFSYPSVSDALFTTLRILIKSHTDKLPLIPKDLFIFIWDTLATSLFSTVDLKIIKICMSSMMHVFYFCIETRQKKNQEAFDPERLEAITHFPQVFFSFLQHSGDTFNPEITELSSDTFFTFLCLSPESFRAYVQSRLPIDHFSVQAKLSVAFDSLCNGAKFNLTEEKDMLNFREKFHNFLTVYRSLGRKQ